MTNVSETNFANFNYEEDILYFDTDDQMDVTEVVEIKMEDVEEIHLDDDEDVIYTEDMAVCLVSDNGHAFHVEHDYCKIPLKAFVCEPSSPDPSPPPTTPDVIYIGQQFSSQAEAYSAVKSYGEATNQVFILAPGCASTKPQHPLHDKFPYSSVRFMCKHGGVYRPHRPDQQSGTIRPNQKSMKTGCPVSFKMKLKLDIRKLVVLEVPDPCSHNHPLSESIYSHYPETRKLSAEESQLAIELLKCDTRPRLIATAINANRRQTGRKGIVISKDILNIGAKSKKATKRSDRQSEDEKISDLFEEQKRRDPNGAFEIFRSDDQLQMIYIQTSKMKETFQSNYQRVHLDSAYKVNSLNFCLYALLAEDENGFGQPVALALLRSESSDSITKFINKFKESNAHWLHLKEFFVKKTFSRRRDLQVAFPNTSILLHPLHVVKIVKSQIVKESLASPEDKVSLVESFKRVVHSKTENEFKQNEDSFLSFCPVKVKEYYLYSLANDTKAWCLAFRENKQTAECSATSHFFHTLKTALTDACPSIAKRFKLSECVEAILSFIKPEDNKGLTLEADVVTPSEMIFVGQQFSSHADAAKAIKSYGEATNQVFFVAAGCARTYKKSAIHSIFPYSSPKFVCKHAGTYRPHKLGGPGPTIRTMQQSCKTDCPVAIKMKLKLKEKVLEVVYTPDIAEHNHPLSEALYSFYPEARKLNSDERKFAIEMLESRITPRAIATAINSNRKQRDKKGIVISKDIINLAGELKRQKHAEQLMIKAEEIDIVEHYHMLDDEPMMTFEVQTSEL